MGNLYSTNNENSMLLKRFNSRDSGAFGKVYLLYYDELFYFTNKLYRDTEISATDVLQDIFIRLWEAKKQQFADLINIKAYLFVSVKNNFKDYIRHQKHIKTHSKISMLDDDNFIAQIVETEVFSFVNNAIGMLPEECGKVLKHYLDGFDAKEIAIMLDKSESTVYNQKNRAIKILKNKMDGNNFIILLALLK